MLLEFKKELKNNQIFHYFDKSMTLSDQMKYRKCLKVKQKLSRLLKKEVEESHILIGFSDYLIGETYYQLKKYHKATPFLESALKVFKQSNNSQHNYYIYEVYNTLYHCSYHLCKHSDVIDYGLKALEYEEIDQREKANILARVARFHFILFLSKRSFSYLIRALHYNTESRKIYLALNDTSNEQYIYSVYDCGDIFYYLEDYQNAVKYFEESLQLATESNLGADLMYNIYQSLANVYQEIGYTDTMLFYKKKSQELNVQ